MATPARRTSKTKKNVVGETTKNYPHQQFTGIHRSMNTCWATTSHHQACITATKLSNLSTEEVPPINYSDQLVLTSFNHLFNRYGLPHAILRYDGSSQAVEITFGDQRAILLFVSLLGYLQADFRTRFSHNGQVVDIDTQNFNVDQVTFIINSVDQNAMDAFINGTN